MTKIAALVGIAGLAAAAHAGTTTLAEWTFETTPPSGAGPHAADGGLFGASSFVTGAHASGSAVFDNPVGNGSFESFSSNNWGVGDYYQFSTSTLGYESITISWDQTSSNTGPRDFNLMWSTDGTNFTQLGSMYAVLANSSPINWNNSTYRPEHTFGPIAAPGDLDDQGTIYFRMVMATTTSANGGTVAGGGTNRVDNIVISGTPVPAPGALALLGLGGLVATRRRR